MEQISLLAVDDNVEYLKRREVESSQEYLGLKLLWIINLFFDGKQFPKGIMNSSQHKNYVYHIIKFILYPNVLKTMLDINADVVFDILLKLYVHENLVSFVKEARET